MTAPGAIRHAARQRLREVWTWLPAFRAVAEVEHVQRAARDLNVTPSSVSRAIKLLEEHLGRPLFDRVGRNIRLNHDGRELLAAVHDGMRRVDDGIARVTGTAFAGELRVACEGDQPLAFAWRAASRLMKKYDGLTTIIEQGGAIGGLADRIGRGEIDIAITTTPPSHERLLVERLGDVTYGIYCGVGHPLHGQRNVQLHAICKHPFVGPTVIEGDGPGDQWPKGVERVVTLRLPALQPAIAVCASGELLAVLPDIAAQEAAERRSLRRLPSDIVPTSSLFTVRRRPTGDFDRTGAFVAELRAELTARRGRRLRPASP